MTFGQRLRALLSAVRPRQWVKNGLVVVAPAAAGVLSQRSVAIHTLVAFAAFTALASSIYLFNDVRDVEADRLHPKKKFRAIASGAVSPRVAVILGIALLASSFLVPVLFLHQITGLVVVLAIYAAIQLFYVLGGKELPVLELAMVASGFLLRSIAGAEASHLYVSSWFLVVISFGALFLVVGKRFAEVKLLESGARAHRKVLGEYSEHFLRSALTLTAGVTVTAYCLWAFDSSITGLSSVHHEAAAIRLTVIPVVLAILHILRLLENGEGGAPEDLVLNDRIFQLLGLAWAICFSIGIYG